MESIWIISYTNDVPSVYLYGEKIPLETFNWTHTCIFSCYKDNIGILDTSTCIAKIYSFDNTDAQIFIDTELYEGHCNAIEWMLLSLKIPKITKQLKINATTDDLHALLLNSL